MFSTGPERYNIGMGKRNALLSKYDRLRDYIYFRYERLFPAPVQVRLLEILGGTTITIGAIRHNNRPLTLTLSRGRLLRSAKFRRQVLDGFGVLANDIKWAIAIQGPEYERDVVAAYERDEKWAEQGWRVAHVRIHDIWQNPNAVRDNLTPFFS